MVKKQLERKEQALVELERKVSESKQSKEYLIKREIGCEMEKRHNDEKFHAMEEELKMRYQEKVTSVARRERDRMEREMREKLQRRASTEKIKGIAREEKSKAEKQMEEKLVKRRSMQSDAMLRNLPLKKN